MGDHPIKHLKSTQEVKLETSSASGAQHTTKLWVVVVEGEPYLRSMNGPSARWYRELVHADFAEIVTTDEDIRLRVAAEHVDDPATLKLVSKAIKKKYGWTHPQYLPRFLDDDSVAATLRLEFKPA
jgi:hypothetical protein